MLARVRCADSESAGPRVDGQLVRHPRHPRHRCTCHPAGADWQPQRRVGPKSRPCCSRGSVERLRASASRGHRRVVSQSSFPAGGPDRLPTRHGAVISGCCALTGMRFEPRYPWARSQRRDHHSGGGALVGAECPCCLARLPCTSRKSGAATSRRAVFVGRWSATCAGAASWQAEHQVGECMVSRRVALCDREGPLEGRNADAQS